MVRNFGRRVFRVTCWAVMLILMLGVSMPVFGSESKLPVGASINSPLKNTSCEIKQVEDYDAFIKALRKAIEDAEETIYLKISNYDQATYDVKNAFRQISKYDYNMAYYNGCSYIEDEYMTIRINYKYPAEELKKKKALAESAAARIREQIIKPGMTDYQKELAVHDYIVTHSSFDTLSLSKGKIEPDSSTPYGVLLKGKAVCEGYARAMQMLLVKENVECLFVMGSQSNQKHAWNIVRINGIYSHLDTTWDDPVTEDGSDIRHYAYFNLTDRELGTDHDWERTQYPSCTSNKLNYYTVSNMTADNYEGLRSLVSKAIEKKQRILSVKVKNYNNSDYNMSKLLISLNKSKQGDKKFGKMSYSVLDKFGIICVTIQY